MHTLILSPRLVSLPVFSNPRRRFLQPYRILVVFPSDVFLELRLVHGLLPLLPLLVAGVSQPSSSYCCLVFDVLTCLYVCRLMSCCQKHSACLSFARHQFVCVDLHSLPLCALQPQAKQHELRLCLPCPYWETAS